MNSKHYDIIVCGAGPSGVASALAASRAGAKVLLLEKNGFCGGMSTAGLVNPWSGHEFYDFQNQKNGSLIGGIFKEIIANLQKHNGYGSILTANAFDEEILKCVYDYMLANSGVKTQFHSYINSIQMKGNHIDGINVFSKGGRDTFTANNFIDCTADADLAALAGVEFVVGRPIDGLTQAMTVNFRMGNVDKSEMIARGSLQKARAMVEPYFQEALASEQLHYPYRNFIHFYDYPRPGVLHFNMTRINMVNGLSASDLTKAEIEGRRQVYILSEWLIKNVPWFKDSFVEKIACQVGVRETRHIKGEYTINEADITSGRKFVDGITRSRYFIDIHNPKGAIDIQQKVGGKGTVKAEFAPPSNDYYEIPYRCIITAKCPNLLVPCRALSATHEASAAIRVMATMVGLGEAAGIAAGQATIKQLYVNEIDGKWVRSQIKYMSEGVDFDNLWKAPLSSLNFIHHG